MNQPDHIPDGNEAPRAKLLLADCLTRWANGESVSLPSAALEDATIRGATTSTDLNNEISKLLEMLDLDECGPIAPAVSESEIRNGPNPNEFHVRCPQCQCINEMQSSASLGDLTCGSCGNTFHVVVEQRVKQRTHIGQFELHERIGVGAFGTVWKAYDAALDRVVAIEISRSHHLEPLEEEQFMREARAAAQLRHPHIVTLYEVGRDGDTLFIVSELVDGVNLLQWLEQHEIGLQQTVEFGRDIALALDHAHQAGVVHRDLKPSNIMVDAQQQIHLMDFGLAKRESAEVTVTADGSILGTPTHMSPELARGDAHRADRRTDIYSTGVILFQCLTGELPFRGNLTMLLNQVLHDEPPSPRKLNHHIPRDLETICLKCLEKEPDRRYATAAELAADLSAFLQHRPIAARPLGPGARTWRWCRRNRSIAALLATVLVLLTAISLGSIVSTVMVTRQRNRAIAERDRNEKFLGYFRDVFRSPDPGLDGRNVTVASVMKKAAADAEEQLADDPMTMASMLDAIGHTYLELGIYSDAIECLERAAAVQRELRIDEAQDSVRTLHSLGSAYQAVGQTVDAQSILERVVKLQRNSLGPNNPATLETMTMLAKVQMDEGHSGEAIRLLREVWQRHRDQRGDDHVKTLAAASNLANVLKDCGQYAEALPLLEQTVKSLQKVHGDHHFQVAAAKTNLAGVYRGNGNIEKALPLYQEALETMNVILGENHAATMTIMNNLAGAYRLSGDMEKALALYQRTYELRRMNLGERHRSTLNTLNSLAVCEVELGHFNEAVALGEKVLKLSLAELGESHPDTLNVMNNLGNALRNAKRSSDAVTMLRRALELREQTLQPEDPDILVTMHCLAIALVDVHATGEALEVLERTLRRREEVLRPNHPDTLATMTALAKVSRNEGHVARAVELERQLKEANRLGAPSP